jgi:hypothetical protein
VNHGRGIIRTFKNKMDFHSNLYNNREADILESAGQIFISNSNLPYFNIKDSLNIWIRMLIGGPRMKPFNIKVSVNCKNAEGITKKIRINPNRMLKTEEENPDRMLNSKEES